jgi:acyl-CoA thioesterase
MPAPADPQALAEACAAAMWADDTASQGLGMELEAVGPGTARMAMTVRDGMVNGHGMCHGGFIFTLADSAFAFACNSRNAKCLAAQGSISFLRPARLGDRLVATAEERHLAGRSGIYDIRVTDQSGQVIAEFRGHSRAIGEVFFKD